MNRRHFLSSTVLAGAGLAGLAQPARAFTLQKCDENDTLACREIARHDDVMAQINALLEQKGLSPAERQAVLAAAACPFCGQPLSG